MQTCRPCKAVMTLCTGAQVVLLDADRHLEGLQECACCAIPGSLHASRLHHAYHRADGSQCSGPHTQWAAVLEGQVSSCVYLSSHLKCKPQVSHILPQGGIISPCFTSIPRYRKTSAPLRASKYALCNHKGDCMLRIQHSWR